MATMKLNRFIKVYLDAWKKNFIFKRSEPTHSYQFAVFKSLFKERVHSK